MTPLHTTLPSRSALRRVAALAGAGGLVAAAVFPAAAFLAAPRALGQASQPATRPVGGWGPEVEARVADFVEASRRAQEIPGLALAVVEGGEVVLARGFGTMGLDRPGEPLREDAVFPVGSLVQGLVATALVQLEEEGRLDLDAPVADLLPAFAGEGSGRDAITVRDLLAHRSGLADYDGIEEALAAAPAGSPEATGRLLGALARADLVAKPGKAYAYSRPAFDVAAAVAARVAGKPFETLVAERILEPLGMTSSGFGASTDGKRVTLHERPLIPAVREEGMGILAGLPGTSFHATAGDLARWVLANLHEGALGERRLVPRARYEEIWKPYFGVLLASGRTWVGLSWFLGVHGARYLVRQSSQGFGHAATLAMLPDEGLGVVLLASADWVDLTAMREGILDRLLGEEGDEPLPAADVPLRHVIATEGIDAALARYDELGRSSPEAYDFGEEALNRLGYDLLALDRAGDAVRILERNVQAFPRSANTHDSLGEAYARAGDREGAIRSYEQALRIDPESRNARRQLRKLKGEPRSTRKSKAGGDAGEEKQEAGSR